MLDTLPDAIAVAYIDLATATVLGVETNSDVVTKNLTRLVKSGVEMFSGYHVVTMEDALQQVSHSEAPLGCSFDMMIASGQGVTTLFLRNADRPERAAMVLAENGVNIGLLSVKAREIMPQIEAALGRAERAA